MKKAVALADRAASLSLWLVALANMLFLLAFLATLLLLAGRAEAAAPACTGKDMIAEMAVSDPAALEKIRSEAAKTPNGAGLLWKIEKEGAKPSFLFGTMHMTDPRVVTLPPVAQAAFDASSTVVIETTDVLDQAKIEKEGAKPSFLFGTMHMTDPRVVSLPADAQAAFDTSETVVIETTDVLDQAKMMASFMEDPELMMFTDKTTLPSLLSPQDEKMVDAALSKRGIPLASVIKMKPWVLSAMVALPACEMARKAAGEPVLDITLARQAKAAGKVLGSLETAKSQLEAMASLPLEFHVEGLVETLRLGDGIDDVIETMIDIYLSGDTGMFWPFFRAALPSSEDGKSGYSAFEETMITSRNGVMVREAKAFLDNGGAFIAVGALHLPGEEGVIELLRKAGYSVSRAD